jgi:HD domain
MSTVGSWDWARATGGRLSRRDRAELIRQGVLARLSRLPGPWRDRLIKDARSFHLPNPPDTALARDAESRVRELSTPALFGHCMRTWGFAELFAQRDLVAHDEELLYAACVLHDLGLTPQHEGKDPTAQCFAVEGARAAHTVVLSHGHSAHRAQVVAEAISLHLNINVSADFGPIATLLSKGVMLDVVGRRLGQLPPSSVAEVVVQWPRDGSSADLLKGTLHQAKLRPDSRAALLHELGFTKLVSSNPLDGLKREQTARSPARGRAAGPRG